MNKLHRGKIRLAATSVAIGFAACAYATEVPKTVPVPTPSPIAKARVQTQSEHKPNTQCLDQLASLGVKFQSSGNVVGENGCGFKDSINVTQIAHGVGFGPKNQVRCETALALANWIRHSVQPATKLLSGNEGAVMLKSIRHASAYSCRRRNNKPDGKLSEHAIGNAIDIAEFEFENHKPLTVQPYADETLPEARFQKLIRKQSCEYFTTLLGPASDGYHGDHFHLDIAQRKGGYRLCR